MTTTPGSLLERLRDPHEADAWSRFVRLYTPLLFTWTRKLGMQESDASDLVQDVFIVLVKQLPEFRYDPEKSFRAWLKTIILNRWRDRCRRKPPAGIPDATLDHLAAPEEAPLFEELEYRQQVIRRALHLMQVEFPEKTWKACWEHVVAGRPAPEVAAELGIAVGSVYVAKSRVLSRLRQEIHGLLE